MKLKVSLIFLLFSFLILPVFSDEIDLSKFYIEKAFSYYKNNDFELAKETLKKSGDFSKTFPEYYYLTNLLLPKVRENNYIKRNNADLILKLIKNNFIIQEYDLLKATAEIYVKVKDFSSAESVYIKLLSIDNVNNTEDGLNYLLMLFKTNKPEFIKKVPEAVERLKRKNETIGYNFYLALSAAFLKNTDAAGFGRLVNSLAANNFDASKILYLKILFYNDAKSNALQLNEYKKLKFENKIDKEYQNRIIYNLLFKSDNFSKKDIAELLDDWFVFGNTDYKTIDIINNARLSVQIKNNEKLKKSFYGFSGTRTKDVDSDGEWEELYQYNNGNLLKHIIDANQDGLKEEETVFFENGKVNFFIIYKNNDEYIKYNFNPIDQSLADAEFYKNQNIYKKDFFVKSLLFLKPFDLRGKVSSGIEFVETFGKEHVKLMFNKNIILYKEVDSGNNGIFDKKIFYKNGVIDYVLIDSNANAYYEIYEKYIDNKLSYILYKSDDKEKIYDYKEEFLPDRILKYWDNNIDGIYEIFFEEYKNGAVRKKYDLNFDGKYDYIFDFEKNNLIKISRVNNVKGKEEIIKVFGRKIEKNKNNNWVVVTALDTAKIIVPESIFISNTKLKNGTFRFDKIEYAFKNGEIKTNSFYYILEFINNQIYLFDKNF